MPNCDFYATPEDHAPLLDWLFAQASCHVYESYSDFESPLRRFGATDEVLAQFQRRYPNGNPWRAVHLQLYVAGAGPAFAARRVKLDPAACDGARFRYAAEGWGLVQLYLNAPDGNRLENSHTNHNSAKRAQAWAATIQDMDAPAAWDFQRITAFSSGLNRQIKKLAVGKLGSRPVLPGAAALWERGVALAPYSPDQDVLQK